MEGEGAAAGVPLGRTWTGPWEGVESAAAGPGGRGAAAVAALKLGEGVGAGEGVGVGVGERRGMGDGAPTTTHSDEGEGDGAGAGDAAAWRAERRGGRDRSVSGSVSSAAGESFASCRSVAQAGERVLRAPRRRKVAEAPPRMVRRLRRCWADQSIRRRRTCRLPGPTPAAVQRGWGRSLVKRLSLARECACASRRVVLEAQTRLMRQPPGESLVFRQRGVCRGSERILACRNSRCSLREAEGEIGSVSVSRHSKALST